MSYVPKKECAGCGTEVDLEVTKCPTCERAKEKAEQWYMEAVTGIDPRKTDILVKALSGAWKL